MQRNTTYPSIVGVAGKGWVKEREMREILFRAKTAMIVGTYNLGKEDGEWVIGQLYCDVGKWVIRQFEFDRADYVGYEVDPETVCQYTGLKDCNGNKIWENDIIFHDFIGTRGTVVWCENDGRFAVDDWIDKIQWYDYDMWRSVEVKGNIFDNPDLLTTSSTDSD